MASSPAPNPLDHNRHIVTTVYNIGWMVKRRTLFFEKGSEAVFEAVGVDANAEFVDQPFEYLFEMACRKLDPGPMRGLER